MGNISTLSRGNKIWFSSERRHGDNQNGGKLIDLARFRADYQEINQKVDAISSYPLEEIFQQIAQERTKFQRILQEKKKRKEKVRELSGIVENIWLRIIRVYAGTTTDPEFDSQGLERNLIAMIAWVRQSYVAVFPKLQSDYSGLLTEDDKELSRHSDIIAVLSVIFAEDEGETMHSSAHTTPLRELQDLVLVQRLSHPKHTEITDISEQGIGEKYRSEAMKKPHRQFADASNWCQTVLYDMEEALALKEEDEALASEGEDDRQIQMVRERMRNAQAEMLLRLEAGRNLSNLVSGPEGGMTLQYREDFEESASALDLSKSENAQKYIEVIQSNIFMRYMFLGFFLQVWTKLTPEQKQQFNFEELLKQIDEIGRIIEFMGTIANHHATIFREIVERFGGNIVLIVGIIQGKITKQQIQEVFQELEDAQLPSQTSKELVKKVSIAVFEKKNYGEESPNLRKGYCLPKFFDLIDKIAGGNGGGPELFQSSSFLWKEAYDGLVRNFNNSSISRLIDIAHLCLNQTIFENLNKGLATV
ncbi:hypothetical protein HZA38_01805 [Candidatus Peregrinibacteria bacterium]|nr:hypothetical protein [Candidatus Peregrinibacteria bacterium]